MQANMQAKSTAAQTTEGRTESLPQTLFYTWRDYRASYELHTPAHSDAGSSLPLLLVHPIGVGLSRRFWHRFCKQWDQTGRRNPIYNPDLLGCGESDMPRAAYTPADWAEQLQHFLQTVVGKPAVVVAQGALLPVAIELAQLQPNLIRGLVLSGPPAWGIMTKPTLAWQQKLTWNLLDSPAGSAFYRYARRRQFLQSFSTKQLFGDANSVDAEWLDTLEAGAANPASRHAVFSFLAGFWRKDYKPAVAAIAQPTLVVFGEKASSISREGKQELPAQRLADYLNALPQGRGLQIKGRNVLPYESTPEFVAAVAAFVSELETDSVRNPVS
jgi:pimeloyl-ACP methyl ester carboxylesterase